MSRARIARPNAQRTMVKRLGLCLDTTGERSLDPLIDLEMCKNFAITSSIKGRFVGSMCVISSTRFCINSKPLYF